VHLEDAAREWEVLPEEVLEDGVRVRGGAPHWRTGGPRNLAVAASSAGTWTSPPRVAERRAGLRSVGPNWCSPPEQLRWTDRTGPMAQQKSSWSPLLS
jgi:hypothetical protein